MMPLETITRDRLEELRLKAEGSDTLAVDLIGTCTVFDPKTACYDCDRRVREGYWITPEYLKTMRTVCEDCRIMRLIRGLLALIPADSPLTMEEARAGVSAIADTHDSGHVYAPHLFDISARQEADLGVIMDGVDAVDKAALEALKKREEAEALAKTAAHAHASAFNRSGPGTINLLPGEKIDVMRLPPGTIIRYPSIKTPVPVNPPRTFTLTDNEGSHEVAQSPNPAEYYEALRGTVEDAGPECLCGDSQCPDSSPSSPAVSVLTDTVRQSFTIDPTPEDFIPAARPRNLEEVQRYEAAYGDPELMALLAEDDADWERAMRDELGDELFEKTYGTKTVTRVDGVAKMRTRMSDQEIAARKSAAVPDTRSAFPSIARRTLPS